MYCAASKTSLMQVEYLASTVFFVCFVGRISLDCLRNNKQPTKVIKCSTFSWFYVALVLVDLTFKKHTTLKLMISTNLL